MESFEFKGIITKENVKDYLASTKIIRIFKTISVLILPIMLLYTFVLYRQNLLINLLASVIIAVFIIIGFSVYLPHKLCKDYFKLQRSVYDNDFPEQSYIYSDKIYSSYKGESYAIEYVQIRQIIDNKSVIVLMSGNTGIIMPKANLINADINDFIRFIEKKTNLKCKTNHRFYLRSSR